MGPYLLLVENRINGKLVRGLANMGWECNSVLDWEAINILNNGKMPYSLLVVDRSMNQKRRDKIVDLSLEKYPNKPIIVISPDGGLADSLKKALYEQKTNRRNVGTVLRKPVTLEVLAKTISFYHTHNSSR